MWDSINHEWAKEVGRERFVRCINEQHPEVDAHAEYDKIVPPVKEKKAKPDKEEGLS